MNTQFYLRSTYQAVTGAIIVLVIIASSFFVLEPKVGQAIVGNPFTIKQTITDEISFLVQAANVVATGTIAGLTGGTANGTTTAVVRTNSANGYNMSIAFTNNGTDNAMLGDVSLSDAIRDYPASSSEPTFGFYTASTSSVFGYTVTADNPSDVDQSFKHTGTDCNTGSSHTLYNCWMEPRVAGFGIINRNSPAGTGATTTIVFRVHVPNNPSPAVTEDVYTATATLTALNN